jgi:5-methylcytosine-specific restriction endonuclease McrA
MKNNLLVKHPVVNSQAAGVMLRWNYKQIEIEEYHQARMSFLLSQSTLKCVKCGRDDLRADIGSAKDVATIDHIKPRSKGGSLMNTENWQVMCRKCNGKKGDEYK